MRQFIGSRATGKTTKLIMTSVVCGYDILCASYAHAESVAGTARSVGLSVKVLKGERHGAFLALFEIEAIHVLVPYGGHLDGCRRIDRELMIDEIAWVTERQLQPYARVAGYSQSVFLEDWKP